MLFVLFVLLISLNVLRVWPGDRISQILRPFLKSCVFLHLFGGLGSQLQLLSLVVVVLGFSRFVARGILFPQPDIEPEHTCVLCCARWILKHWTIRAVLSSFLRLENMPRGLPRWQ